MTYLSVDELVATMRRSSLPTVVVEGQEDMQIYRWIENRIGHQRANVLSAGGRNNLLSVFNRRNEYPHLPVAFVADKDLWVFGGIPGYYRDIIFTQGYSIENDLYTDANLEHLLNVNKKKEHQQVLDVIIKWFAFEVGEHFARRLPKVGTECNTIVPPGKTQMDNDFRKQRGYKPPDEELYQKIKDKYQLKLRGKQLFELLDRFLDVPNLSSTSTLYKTALQRLSSHPHSLINHLIGEIRQTIAKQTPSN